MCRAAAAVLLFLFNQYKLIPKRIVCAGYLNKFLILNLLMDFVQGQGVLCAQINEHIHELVFKNVSMNKNTTVMTETLLSYSTICLGVKLRKSFH